MLKVAAHKIRRDAHEKTSWRAPRFFLFSLCCNGYKPCEVKRGREPCLVEATLTTWMDECADQMVCPTPSEIKDEGHAMADKRTTVQNPALLYNFGKTWWTLFKRRSSAFVSRLAKNYGSQRAFAHWTPQQWTEFFQNHLKPGLENVAYNPCRIWNEDESGLFRQFPDVG